MATIRPFRAVKPQNGMEEKIASLPYDVFNRKEAKEYVLKNPESFLRIDRAESLLSDDTDTYDEIVYEKAKAVYEEMKDEGKFVKEVTPCLYLYEQTMNGRAQTGLVCVSSVIEYEKNIIKKHENTRADKELDRIKHVDKLNAQTGPIFLAHKDLPELNEIFNSIKKEPAYCDFYYNDVRQRCWKIEEKDLINKIIFLYESIENLYIADGHHRCASACKVSKMRREMDISKDLDKEYNFFLSVIFPESELMIMDYNRVIKSMNGLSEEAFLSKVQERFEITEIPVTNSKPTKKGDIYMFLNEKEYQLNIKPEYDSTDPIDGLDVSILQNNLLAPILNITDPKKDSNIDFVGGIRGVEELRRRISTDCKCAFSMFPTSMKELFNVADAGLLMPPKSTWFEPKLLSGLFIHELED